MLGFGKKKREQEKEAANGIASTPPGKKPAAKDKQPKGKEPAPAMAVVPKPLSLKKKFLGLKKFLIFFLLLGIIGALGFLAYTQVFTAKSPDKSIYEPVALAHVNLPPEMLKFCFENFPELYAALRAFNHEITLFEGEIAWIEEIARKYPEQQKITDAEKKIWEKGRAVLLKEFSRLETPIKESYVLFQVNETQGLEQIKEKEKEMTDIAQNALKAAHQQTEKIDARRAEPPKGVLQSLLYNLKKKFL